MIKINAKKVIKKVIAWKISIEPLLHEIQESLCLPLKHIFEVFKLECKNLAILGPIKSKEESFFESYSASKVCR